MRKIKQKIRYYRAILIEIIETLCSICLYLEMDGRHTRNEEYIHMRSHFNMLKSFSTDLRGIQAKENKWTQKKK